MSRAESGYGRRRRRGGSRRAESVHTEEHVDDRGPEDGYGDQYDPEEDFSADYGHTHTRTGDGHDDYDDISGAGYEEARDEEEGRAQEAGRTAGRQGRRRDRKGVGRVSAFSASAIKRVSVLGDRPNQIVYTLAEQSKRKRGTAVLAVLLGAFSIALVALLGLLIHQLLTGSGSSEAGGEETITAPPEGHSTITPELYLFEPDDPEVFGPIAERPEDVEPMTEESVFGPVEELDMAGMQLELRESEVSDSCTSLVWGEELGQSLLDANCLNAASGVYTDADEDYIAQVTLFDLSDSEGATDVAASLDPTNPESEPGFLLARDMEGVDGLQEGYSQATTQVMGHYLAVYWVASTDGSPPGDDSGIATASVVSQSAFGFVYDEVVAHKPAEEEE
ncbi:hypothetical protein GCM10007079_32850 [Nocardiopsis terrae]|uniref:Uncharacterized protein n=1 Tax=Nocardiopsis terrae TaxID=372655 RepID=A0ABR9HJB5_9ACTN|nr:hypothetical protein [Nocardiopsis terrae]MBE1459102.1 hypothetical protein [Nocardiopsis terrae]GHC88131.1 hypothetical protein GCM10007079_32850 [Nocardiopsis terrae]